MEARRNASSRTARRVEPALLRQTALAKRMGAEYAQRYFLKAQIHLLGQIFVGQLFRFRTPQLSENKLSQTSLLSCESKINLQGQMVDHDWLTSLFTFTPRHRVAVSKVLLVNNSSDSLQPETPARGQRMIAICVYWSFGHKATAAECQKMQQIKEAFFAYVRRDEPNIANLVATVLSACSETFFRRCEDVVSSCFRSIPDHWDQVLAGSNFMGINPDLAGSTTLFEDSIRSFHPTVQAELRERGTVCYFNLVAFEIQQISSYGKAIGRKKADVTTSEKAALRAGDAGQEEEFEVGGTFFKRIFAMILRVHKICEHDQARRVFDQELLRKLLKLDKMYGAITQLAFELRQALHRAPNLKFELFDVGSDYFEENYRFDPIEYLNATLDDDDEDEDEEEAGTMEVDERGGVSTTIEEVEDVTVHTLRSVFNNPNIVRRAELSMNIRYRVHPELQVLHAMLRLHPHLDTLRVSTSHAPCLWCQVYLDQLGKTGDNRVLHVSRLKGPCPVDWLPPDGADYNTLEGMTFIIDRKMREVRAAVKAFMSGSQAAAQIG